jgi:hypothetical protein
MGIQRKNNEIVKTTPVLIGPIVVQRKSIIVHWHVRVLRSIVLVTHQRHANRAIVKKVVMHVEGHSVIVPHSGLSLIASYARTVSKVRYSARIVHTCIVDVCISIAGPALHQWT